MFETAEIRKNRKGNISYWENGVLIGKKCIECGEDKEISKFNFLNKAKGIYRPICNDCRHIQRKKCRDSKVEIAKIFIDGNEIEIRINKSGNVTYWEKGVMVGRKCTECGKDKKIDEFNFHSTKKGTYRSKCRECQNKYGRGYYKSNPDKAKEGQRKWKKNNTDRIKEHKKKSREKANIL